MADYRALAALLADQIAAGRLRPGDRLPTHRRLAVEQGVAVSTVSRAFAELTRRGLVTGEVGRGTFVRSGAPDQLRTIGAEPAASIVDLEYNFPVVTGQPEMMNPALQRLLRQGELRQSLAPVGVAGTKTAQAAVARTLQARHAVAQHHILFAGNGRQAIAAAIGALVPSGGRLGVERLTYPVVRGIAARSGVELVPLDIDDQGVDPASVRAAHRKSGLHAVYLQPALHNPLGVALSERRKVSLARTLADTDLPMIEDAIYSFLHDRPSVAESVAERVVVVDSLSKRLAPGLTVGVALTPRRVRDRIATALRLWGWGPSRFALAAATSWLNDGTAAAVQELKRRDAGERQQLARQRLAGFDVRSAPESYHLWWTLPAGWRADLFVAAAARSGVAVTPAAAFAAVDPEDAPHAVRLALASPAPHTLADALDTLAAIARSPVGHDHVVE